MRAVGCLAGRPSYVTDQRDRGDHDNESQGVDVEQQRICAKCGERSVGPGGVLCPACFARLTEQARDYWSASAAVTGAQDRAD